MSELGALAIGWCVLTLLLAGTVKGLLGIGIPIISISLLSLVLDVPTAAALLPIPILVANLWQSLTSGFAPAALARFWPLVLTLVVGTFVGARMLVGFDERVLLGVVGTVVLAFSLTGHFPVSLRVPRRGEAWIGALVGLLAGVLSGMTTIAGPPVIMFLFALRLDKDEFVGCISTLYLCASVPLIVAFGWVGVLGAEALVWSSAAVLPIFAGMMLGQWLRPRVSQEAFRRGLLVVLLLVALRLLQRAFGW
ncbi:MAG: sulfite exporter TauE/SafE family protein [Gammaproteobacteria bacterium]|nr:sulfite exporter TauE/SafE family protein [Gammaproteobacteria bacterium]